MSWKGRLRSRMLKVTGQITSEWRNFARRFSQKRLNKPIAVVKMTAFPKRNVLKSAACMAAALSCFAQPIFTIQAGDLRPRLYFELSNYFADPRFESAVNEDAGRAEIHVHRDGDTSMPITVE